MTIIHTGSPRTCSVRRPIDGPVQRPRHGRVRTQGSRRPGPCGPADARPRYRGTGVARSVAPHHRRGVTWAKTAGVAVAAGLITLWLGLVADVGRAVNGEFSAASAPVPDRLVVVWVEPGESLQDVAHRVAPEAPVSQVAERIRALNDLNSPALAAGQPLIAPVG